LRFIANLEVNELLVDKADGNGWDTAADNRRRPAVGPASTDLRTLIWILPKPPQRRRGMLA